MSEDPMANLIASLREPGFDYGEEPPRGPLPPRILKAARIISPVAWKEQYKPGAGPMHMAGGPFWRQELLRMADVYTKLASAARTCAEFLPPPSDKEDS